MRRVLFLLFDQVELLDFAGPMEVFSIVARGNDPHMEIQTCSKTGDSNTTTNGLRVVPQFSFSTAPWPHILVVPGGIGTRKEMKDDAVIEWVRNAADRAELVLSVCTGSLILAKAGLLEGLEITSHHAALDLLRTEAPNSKVHADRRFVDNGKVVVSAGVSAGIDMAFHILERLHGAETAKSVAKYIEYEWPR